MALSRVTVWVDGNILTALDLNNEFNNIIANAAALISPLTANLDFNDKQATNMVLENFTAFPLSTVAGELGYLAAEKTVYMTDGSTVNSLPVGPNQALSRVQGLTGSLISNIGTFAAQGYQAIRGAGWVTNYQPLVIASTASFTINTQTAGTLSTAAGGRDQAAAFASTDVHFYLVSTGVRSTSVLGCVSSNPPPTGPAIVGTVFTHWAYLCSAKYSTASSAVANGSWLVQGSRIYPKQFVVLDLIATTTGEITHTLSTVVPSVASQVDISAIYDVIASASGTLLNATFNVGTESSPGVYPASWNLNVTVPATGRILGQQRSLSLRNTGTYYSLITSAAPGGTGGIGFALNSYTVSNGDN